MEPQIACAHLRVAEKSHPGKTLKLKLARMVDALANRSGRFARDPIGQVLVLHCGHFDMDVDSIEQRTRDSRAVALNRDWRARAFVLRVSVEAARARIHRSD